MGCVESRVTVSVCIPTWNRSRLLREAMQSVLGQTFEDLELVVCDNASDDDTEQVVRSFPDPRIRYLRSSRNLGHRENWNRCLSQAKGEYIAILPDDDIMLSENIGRKVEVLRRNPQVGLVHSKFHLIDEHGQIVRSNTNWGHGPDREADAIENRMNLLTAFVNTINVTSVLFRRACYERLGGFSDRVRLAFDWEYWMRTAVHYDIAFLAEPLVQWRIHSQSITKTSVRNPIVQLKEDLAAKKTVFKYHARLLPDTHRLERQMWRNMAERVFRDGQLMVESGWSEPDARRFVVQLCSSYPSLILEGRLRKVLWRSLLHRSVSGLLARKATA
jgi:glycosyltransferase involved in cell wall biosynthesis